MRVRSPSFPSPRVIPVSSPTWTGLSTHSSSCRIPETTKSSTVSGSPGLGADLLELHSDSRWGLLQKPTACPCFSASIPPLFSRGDRLDNPLLGTEILGGWALKRRRPALQGEAERGVRAVPERGQRPVKASPFPADTVRSALLSGQQPLGPLLLLPPPLPAKSEPRQAQAMCW